MPLEPYALTTLDAAFDRIGHQVPPEPLERDINAYSKAIAVYTQREFMPKTPASDASPTVARLFAYDGSGVLSLAPYELRPLNLGAIVLHSDQPGSQETLAPGDVNTASDYRLEPRNRTPEGTYLWLRLPELGRGVYRQTSEVSVTGRWGVGTVPADVELACLIAVTASYRNPEGFESRSLGEFAFADSAVDPTDLGSLPLASRRLLNPYRRVLI